MSRQAPGGAWLGRREIKFPCNFILFSCNLQLQLFRAAALESKHLTPVRQLTTNLT
jgi:hypothetical protein